MDPPQHYGGSVDHVDRTEQKSETSKEKLWKHENNFRYSVQLVPFHLLFSTEMEEHP